MRLRDKWMCLPPAAPIADGEGDGRSSFALQGVAKATRKPHCRKETARCRSCYKFKSGQVLIIGLIACDPLEIIEPLLCLGSEIFLAPPLFESQASELQTYRHKTELNAKW